MAKKRLKKVPLGLLLALLAGAALIAGAIYFQSTAPQPKKPTLKIYLTRGDELVAVERLIAAKEAPLSRAIDALLAGPTETEQAAGIQTMIPPGTRLLHCRINDKVAIIDFNQKLENYGGGSARIEGLIAQIVYTATDVPGVEKAWLWIEGNKELVLGGEGMVLDKPLGRADVSR
jgi:spore germination protein GerM